MTPYSELRRLLLDKEKATPSYDLDYRARYALFTSRLFRGVPELQQKRKDLIFFARAVFSVLRHRQRAPIIHDGVIDAERKG